MDLYGYFAFMAGLGIGWFYWPLNENVPGMMIYQLYCDVTGKLDKILSFLDDQDVYDEYVDTYKSRMLYRNYCKAVEAYLPVAKKRQRYFMQKYLIYEFLRPQKFFPTFIAIVVFIGALHWLLFGIMVYLILRYIYHYIEIGRKKEPLALITYLAADAVLNHKQTRKKPKMI